MSEPTIPEPAPLKCFVIMPFADTTHTKGAQAVSIVATEWTHIYKQWIKKAVESYPDRKIECKRSEAAPGNFIKGIIQDLNSNHLVVTDLTGSRPNVYYELGIRHALRTGTIMITQTIDAVPSDLRNYYCFQYDYTEKGHEYEIAYPQFSKEMHEKIRFVLNENFPSDSPVSDFLQFSHYTQAQAFHSTKLRVSRALSFLQMATSACYEAMKKVSKEMSSQKALIVTAEHTRNKEMFDAAYGRLLFDADMTLFPQDWSMRMQAYIIKAHYVLSGFTVMLSNLRQSSDPSGGASSLAALLVLDELKTLINELESFKEPVAGSHKGIFL